MIGSVEACLTNSQITAINQLAILNNISNSTLFDIFYTLCDKSYTKGEMDIWRNATDEKIDTKLDELHNINDTIVNQTTKYLENYTSYFETQINLIDRINLVINLTNATTRIDQKLDEYDSYMKEIDDKLDINKRTTIDEIDELLNNINSNDLVTKKDLEALDYKLNQSSSFGQSNVPVIDMNNPLIYILGGIVAIGGFMWWNGRKQRATEARLARRPGAGLGFLPGMSIMRPQTPEIKNVKEDEGNNDTEAGNRSKKK